MSAIILYTLTAVVRNEVNKKVAATLLSKAVWLITLSDASLDETGGHFATAMVYVRSRQLWLLDSAVTMRIFESQSDNALLKVTHILNSCERQQGAIPSALSLKVVPMSQQQGGLLCGFYSAFVQLALWRSLPLILTDDVALMAAASKANVMFTPEDVVALRKSGMKGSLYAAPPTVTAAAARVQQPYCAPSFGSLQSANDGEGAELVMDMVSAARVQQPYRAPSFGSLQSANDGEGAELLMGKISGEHVRFDSAADLSSISFKVPLASERLET